MMDNTMVSGDIFLYLALIFGLFSLILLWQAPSTAFLDVLRPQRIWFMRLSAVSLTLAVLWMAYYLITSNFSINYVYSYTSLDLAPIYKLSALWTGEVGSMLFFSWVLLLIAAYWYERHQERGERSIILVLGLLMLLITISMGPFASTLQKHPDFSDIPQDGLGLNPLLVNIWMILHPPGIFIGYALMVVVFALAVMQNQNWESQSRGFARWAWLILSIGIISGCVWSYEVWESYWIWDPAFTSSLMVWLLFTAYIHTLARYRRSGNFKLLAPSIGTAGFVMALYSTYIIRSGTIQSVHSFGIGEKKLWLLYLVAILFILSIILIIKKGLDHKEVKPSNGTGPILSDNNLFLLTTVLFILLSTILFTGLSYSLILDILGSGLAISLALFSDWSYPLTVLLLLVMGVCMFKHQHRNHALILAVIFVILSTAFGITGDRYDDISLAAISFAAIGSLYKIRESVISKASLQGRLYLFSHHFIHLGIVILLLGVLISTYCINETIYFRSINEKYEVGNYEIQLVDLAFPVQHKPFPTQLSKIGTYNIYKKNGPLIASGDAIFVQERGEYTTYPFIHKGLLSDVRITYQGVGTMTPIFFSLVNIKIVPGMSVIWLGCLLIVLGIIPKVIFKPEFKYQTSTGPYDPTNKMY
jgi:cytochrome c-type biogenesis protein CcmF